MKCVGVRIEELEAEVDIVIRYYFVVCSGILLAAAKKVFQFHRLFSK